jgi:hypothetical protein
VPAFAITEKKSLLTIYVGIHASEDEAWMIYLGYPSREELADAKMRLICSQVAMYPVEQLCLVK